MKKTKGKHRLKLLSSKHVISMMILLGMGIAVNAQVTNTTSTGNWSNSGIWDNGVPADAGTSTVNHNVTLDQDLKINGTGSCTVNSTLIDNTGGSQYKGVIENSSIFTINGDVTFEEEVKFSNSSSGSVNLCAVLTTGNLLVENDAIIYIDPCSKLIVNGDLDIKNDAEIICDGEIIINGNVTATNNGKISGAGSMTTLGDVEITNDASVFGDSDPCSSSPCEYGDITGIWTGTKDTDWSVANNWSSGKVPSEGSSIIVPNVTNQPVLDQDRIIGALTIELIASIDLNGFNLTVGKDLINSGTVNPNNGEISFISSNPQLIIVNNDLTLYDLTINNSSGVTLSTGIINLSGSLTLTSGLFSTNNGVTLISDQFGTARIAEITGGSITGDVTMQRYIDAGATNWRFLTSAIAGTTIGDFNDDFITSGFTGADFPLWPTPANPWASIYYYDETQIGIMDSGFVAVTSTANSLAVGEGIWVWSGDTITGTQPFTIDITGPANTGNINLPMTYTNTGNPLDDGWNMVGNPYPSSMDWDDPSISKTGINNAIYIWNPDLQQFASYVGGFGINGGSKDIASSQAFWLQATSPTVAVQVTETSKTTDGGAFLKQGSPSPLTINVSNSNGADQTIINFDSMATNGFDALFDALKMTSTATNVPSISTLVTGSTEYSINQLPEQEIDIPLKITTGVTGIHQIDFTGVSNFSYTGCLILEDLFTGNVYDLNATSSVTTFIYDTTTTARFLIKFGARIEITANDISCYGNNDGDILFEKNSPNSFDVTWKDNLGNVVSSNTNVNVSDGINNLSAGTYTIETTDNTCGDRIDIVMITEPNQIVAQFNPSADTIYLSNGGNITFTNQSTSANYYDWDFDDLSTSNLASPSHQYTQVGSYFVTLNAYQNANCYETISKTIEVLNMITAINDFIELNSTKVWVNTNNLLIQAVNIDKIEIRNIVGQLLFESDSKEAHQEFNLDQLTSQTLVVTVISKNQASSTKINYIKK